MLCPLCHTQNRDNAKFCKGCGRTLPIETGAAEQDQLQGRPIPPAAPQTNGETEPTEVALPTQQSQQSQQSQQAAPAQAMESAGAEIDETVAAERVPSDQYHAGNTEGGQPDPYADISTAPTQILTQQQMQGFHQRRWQQEMEREQQNQHDPAEMPTQLNPPASTFPPGIESDLADYPTVIVPPVSESAPGVPLPPQSQSQQAANAASEPTLYNLDAPARQAPHVQSSEAETQAEIPPTLAARAPETVAGGAGVEDNPAPAPIAEQETEKNKRTSEAERQATTGQTASTTDEEGFVEQRTGPETAQSQTNTAANPASAAPDANTAQAAEAATDGGAQEQAAGAFPLLAVGTLAGGRYEVTQVVSDSADEHIYAVTDRQGYQHCWNCGSEENAEGDEFCNDCGAELLNAPYVMHEYPRLESQGADARVLQGVIANTFVEQGHTYVIEQPQASQIVFPNGVHLLASSDSDAGAVRRGEPNEDSTLALLFERVHESISSPVGIFIIADGMGGHANGQGASRATIALISERIVRELIMPPLSAEKSGQESKALDEDSLLTLLHGSIEDANTALCQINQRDKTDMGSTLTGYMVVGDHAYIFNVGDSRTYMLRDEKLYQLTNDHSLVGQLVAGGLIEPEDVYTHPQRNQIFRSIGDKLNVQIDLFKQQVHPGDILLSCSDGLWEMVRDPQITDILNHATDPQTACKQLIEAANANGGEDNVSAVVVFVR